MSNHLSIEQLLALREPGTEPGTAALREHLDGCAECQAEQRRLDQRVARLRALPGLRPARDQWPAIRATAESVRHQRRARWLGVGGLAAAAALAGAVITGDLVRPELVEASTDLSSAMMQSRALEEALRTWEPETRVTDGYTARVAGELEERIAKLDRELEASQFLGEEVRHDVMLNLWRERVGLLDALVDVHVASASNVGL